MTPSILCIITFVSIFLDITNATFKKLDISSSQSIQFLEDLELYQATHFKQLPALIGNELDKIEDDNPNKKKLIKKFDKTQKNMEKLLKKRKKTPVEKVSAEYHLRWPMPFETFNIAVDPNVNQGKQSLEDSSINKILSNYCIRAYNEFKRQLELPVSETSEIREIMATKLNILPNETTMLINDQFFKFQSYLYSIDALHTTEEVYLKKIAKNDELCKDNEDDDDGAAEGSGQCKAKDRDKDSGDVFVPDKAFFMTNYEYTALNTIKWEIFECIYAFFQHTRKLDELPRKYRDITFREELVRDLFIWIGVHSNGSYHSPHVHHDSMVSGSYYVNIPKINDDGGVLSDNQVGSFVLHDSRGSIWPFGLNLPLKAKEGQLYLFPSWVKHHVEPTISKSPRIALSFNVHGTWKVLTTMEKVLKQGNAKKTV